MKLQAVDLFTTALQLTLKKIKYFLHYISVFYVIILTILQLFLISKI